MVAAEGDLDTKKGQLELNVKRAGLAKTVLTVETKPSLFAETEATAFVVDKAAQAQTLELPSAPQAMSIVSFATSVAENSDEELPFPPLPAEAEDGSPFLCPYCLQYQQVKHEGSEHRWRYERLYVLRGLANSLQKACPPRSRALYLHIFVLRP